MACASHFYAVRESCIASQRTRDRVYSEAPISLEAVRLIILGNWWHIYTGRDRITTAHNVRDFDCLKFRAAPCPWRNVFSRRLHPIAASSAASAADLAPTPAPIEGWTITLGVDPRFSTSFPGAKSVSIGRTGYISYRRPGEPRAICFSRRWIWHALPGPSLDQGWSGRALHLAAHAQRRLWKPLATTTIYGLHNVGFTAELAAFWNSGRRLLSRPLGGAPGGQRRPGLRWQRSNSDLVQRYDAFTFRPAPLPIRR